MRNDVLYEKLREHFAHEIVIARYGNDVDQFVNFAVECITCNEVIIDADHPDWAEEEDDD